jgi:hypothetical protein
MVNPAPGGTRRVPTAARSVTRFQARPGKFPGATGCSGDDNERDGSRPAVH